MLLRMNGALHKSPSRSRSLEHILSIIVLGPQASSPARVQQNPDRDAAYDYRDDVP